MKLFFSILLGLASGMAISASASEDSIEKCVSAWRHSPFKASATPNSVIKPGVKVFGVGSAVEDRAVTPNPQLVLVKPGVNVLGKTTYRLMNPNGWYCFKSNVSVLGKLEIEAHCKAHIATAADGANVLGADESENGVAVLGAIRVKRVGCTDHAKDHSNN